MWRLKGRRPTPDDNKMEWSRATDSGLFSYSVPPYLPCGEGVPCNIEILKKGPSDIEQGRIDAINKTSNREREGETE